jgi:hypothetical protein
MSDLVFAVEARDAGGECVTDCTLPFTVYAVIENPCPVDVVVPMSPDCVINQFSQSYPSGDGEGWASDCGPRPGDTVTIAAGGRLEELETRIGGSERGTYEFQAWFTTMPIVTASALINVP